MDLLKVFNKEQIEIINYIKDICEDLEVKAYIVGGAVRDALIGKPLNDIDICISEDPKIVMDSMRNISYFEYHEQFQTAAICFNNGVNIDLIRCRKETYAQDGALPEITPSTIEDDLYRRDFTVNALAYSITEQSLIDFYNGLEDLNVKRLRSIHERSYVEDPTRIFRAVKYAARYNFQLFDRDEIKNVVKRNILNSISNDRIIKEIYLICKEERWIDNFKLCNELGALSIDCEKLGQSNPIFNCYDLETRIINVFYALKKQEDKEYFLNNSFLNKDLKKNLIYYNRNQEKIVDLLLNTVDNYEIYNSLKDVGLYGIILFAWNNEITYKVANYFYNLREIKLNMNGNDIANLGVKDGKIIGAVLKYMLRLKVNIGFAEDKKYVTENLGEIIKCL